MNYVSNKTKDLVLVILEKFPLTRDSDQQLYAKILNLFCPIKKGSKREFSKWLSTSISFNSASRARRILQNKYKHIRGKKYNKRRDQEREVRTEMRYSKWF